MASTRRFVGGRWVDVPDRPNGVLNSIRRNNGGKTIAEPSASDKRFRWSRKSANLPFSFEEGPGRKGLRFMPTLNVNEDGDYLGGEPVKQGDGVSPGSRVEFTGNGVTGYKISVERSPMAGARTMNPFDAVREDIRNKAVMEVENQHWVHPKFESTHPEKMINTADKEAMDTFKKESTDALAAAIDRRTGQFVDNLTKSIQDNVEKNWKPTQPSAAATALDGAVKKPNEGLDEASSALKPENQWNGPVVAVADATKGVKTQTAEVKDLTEKTRAYNQETKAWLDNAKKDREDTEKWMKDFAKQNGLKDPTQSAAKGGKALDILISSLDRYGASEAMSGETELTKDEVTEYEASRMRARDAGLPVDDTKYRRDEDTGKVYRKWSKFDLSDGEKRLLRPGKDSEVAALAAMFDYAKSGGEGARDVRDIRSLAWNLRRNRAMANGGY